MRENPLNKIEEVRKLNWLLCLSRLNLKDTGLTEEFADKVKIEVLLVLPKIEVLDKEEITEEDREEVQNEAEERKRKAQEEEEAR